jgi:DNA-binding LytR/AlgR family response regulator
MVNVDRIRELRQDADGNWEVILVDATRLTAGRDADNRLREALYRGKHT